jgi:hypothetical protein
MTPEYIKLSFLTARWVGKADLYLLEPYFQRKLRAHPWSLTPALAEAWKKEAISKGVPPGLLEDDPMEVAMTESPEFIEAARAAQRERDAEIEEHNRRVDEQFTKRNRSRKHVR